MTAPTLRPYQQQLVDRVEAQWAAGARNVLMRADTGAGKTVMLADIIRRHDGASCMIAHRSELVGQLSLTLARLGVRHDLIAADTTRRAVARAHVEEIGTCYYQPGARCAVASVDTLVRASGLESWARQVTLWVCDEAHHLTAANKWGSAIAAFTNAQCRGLGPTATPCRADGAGLGRHADGLMDTMVEGPPMRWLIDQGYLTDYRIVCPPSDLQVLAEPGASGDWSPAQLRDASQRSHIVGDVVDHYHRYALGRLGITFCTDVDTATEVTAMYRASGVPAETLTGKTADADRRSMLRRYRAREVLQLVTVDIVSEGFDLPAIEVASMARPTQSLALYMQQFGRALRPMAGKDKALIIDHCSNVLRHGVPDRPRIWTLDRRDKRASTKATDVVAIRVCTECFTPYERFYKACPFCGHVPVVTGRGSPAQVEGDLAELSPEVLAALRGAVVDVDLPDEQIRLDQAAKGADPAWIPGHVRSYNRKREAQIALREAMGRWGAQQLAAGLTDAEMQRRFWVTYGLDVLSAQALPPTEAQELTTRIDSAVNSDRAAV